MKIRTGFVSNSSSSSFILVTKNYDAPESTLYRSYGDVLEHAEYLNDKEFLEEIKTRHKNGEFLGFVTVPNSLFNEMSPDRLLEIFKRCGLEKLSVFSY